MPKPAKANIFDWRLWNADYKMQKQNYSDARYLYEQIRNKDARNPRVDYNLGVALYRQENYEKSEQIFAEAAAKAKTKATKSRALYDLGNSQFKQESYESAIASYEEALKFNPKDEDAQFNLDLAKKLLEKKKDDKDKDKNKDKKDKNKDKKDDKGSKGKQDQNKQDQNKDQKNDESPNAQGQGQPQPKKDQKQKPGNLSPDDVNRLLMQVEEAKPGTVRPLGKKNKPNNQLNPW